MTFIPLYQTSAFSAKPGQRIVMPKSRMTAVIISNQPGETWAVRECDGARMLLDRLDLYTVANVSAEGAAWAMEAIK